MLLGLAVIGGSLPERSYLTANLALASFSSEFVEFKPSAASGFRIRDNRFFLLEHNWTVSIDSYVCVVIGGWSLKRLAMSISSFGAYGKQYCWIM